MKLYELGSTPVDGKPAIQLAERIKLQCQPFIKEWGGIPNPKHALYRGMVRTWPQCVFHTIANRPPIQMSTHVQNKLDDFFEQEFNHRYRSDYVVFLTGNTDHTYVFGEPHIIFPIGKFTYLWSPEIMDMNYALINDSVDDIIQTYNFLHNKSLHKVTDHEVMLNVKTYFAIPLNVYTRSIYPLLLG